MHRAGPRMRRDGAVERPAGCCAWTTPDSRPRPGSSRGRSDRARRAPGARPVAPVLLVCAVAVRRDGGPALRPAHPDRARWPRVHAADLPDHGAGRTRRHRHRAAPAPPLPRRAPPAVQRRRRVDGPRRTAAVGPGRARRPRGPRAAARQARPHRALATSSTTDAPATEPDLRYIARWTPVARRPDPASAP